MGDDTLVNAGAFALQVSVIAVAATALLSLVRIASAGARYACWRIALLACLVMPLLLQRPAAPVPLDHDAVQPDLALVAYPVVPDGSTGTDEVQARWWDVMPWAALAASVMVLGAIARGGWLAIGLWRLRRLRRSGRPLVDRDYEDLQQTLNTRAEIRSVAGLEQPATCGLWRPVVLLPDSLAAASVATRRAVVAHELFHVQRRDWGWVLAEESLRTALWFHPAVAWLVSRIQLAREELVDELTVLATGNRKAYIEALLAFADGGRARPAPAFARRRHLFTRIVRLSKEHVMSSPRIVVSAAVVITVVLTTGWYAGSLFPIVTAAPAPEVPAAIIAPVTALAHAAPAPSVAERVESPQVAGQGARSGGAARPGPAPVPAPAVQANAITPENPIPRRLSSVPITYPAELIGSGSRGTVTVRVTVDTSGAVADVQRVTAQATAANSAEMGRAIAAFVTATTDAVRQWRYQPPAEPPIAFFVTARFDVQGDAIALQSDGATAGVPSMNVDRVRELERSLQLLRTQREQRAGQPAASPAEIAELDARVSELAREFERAMEERARASATSTAVGAGSSGLSVPAPAGPVPGARAPTPSPLVSPSGVAPVRVGGTVRPPAKTKHVPPAYPEAAMTARIQGVVIMELLIDEQGHVADARVLRSIPLLDQAALDAARQWEFIPTLLNGAPVPVLLTVTTQFTLTQ